MSDAPSHLKLRVFVSSVQKELAEERMEMKVLLTSDPFLSRHTVPCLFEQYPVPLRPDKKAYLKVLEKCQVYVLIIGREYGAGAGLSATHLEYDFAQERQFPTLVCVKGDNGFVRDEKEEAFFQKVRNDGHTYNRFQSLEELHASVRSRLIEHIKATYELSPTKQEKEIGESSAALASAFERQEISTRDETDLAPSLVAEFSGKIDPEGRIKLTAEQHTLLLLQRGYLWFHPASGTTRPTGAGLVLLGRDPSSFYPQCRIQLDVYPGRTKEDEAVLAESIRANIPAAIEAVIRLILTHTRRTPRIAGLRRVELPEYPEVALREALVNALAHRDYEDPSQRVFVEVFFDRIVVVNPGLPVGHPSLKRLEKGEARARSRNPLLSQGLVFLGLMEERGTGIRRMRKAMLEHGLDLPHVATDDGRFVLTLPGPADDLSRIKAPAAAAPPQSSMQELNKRQLAVLELALAAGSVTNRQVQEQFKVVKDTAFRDLTTLCELGLLQKEGQGRSTRYVTKIPSL